MAKTNFDAAIKELKKDYKKVLKEAVQYATEEAQKDVYTKALICLEEYYANYDPSSYDRTNSLRRAFVPYSNIKGNNTHVVSTVGVEYNTGLLTTYVVGSNDYGNRDVDKNKEIIPIEEWIMDNYLDGIHPTTNGSSVVGQAVYTKIIDNISPTQKMDDYLEKYANTFRDHVYSYLAAYLLK